jgi:hypothetical protein
MTKPLYFYNGSTFELVGPTTPQSPIAYQTSAPTAPATGDIWIDSDGDVDTYNRQLTRYYFVATAAQTTITGTDANGLTLAYVAGSEAVYVNGALQVRGQDYTATNGTSVVLSSGLAVNDVVEIFAYTAFTVANAYTKSETDGVAAAAAGLRMVVPTSVAVGSGSGSVDAIGNVTFSSASSISLNGCFTSVYDNYKIMINTGDPASTQLFTMRLRSGTDNSSAIYYRMNFGQGTGGSTSLLGVTQTSFGLGYAGNGSHFMADVTMFNPFSSTLKTGISGIGIANNSGYNGITGWTLNNWYDATTSFDGFSLLFGANTTGTVRVYGYKD